MVVQTYNTHIAGTWRPAWVSALLTFLTVVTKAGQKHLKTLFWFVTEVQTTLAQEYDRAHGIKDIDWDFSHLH